MRRLLHSSVIARRTAKSASDTVGNSQVLERIRGDDSLILLCGALDNLSMGCERGVC